MCKKISQSKGWQLNQLKNLSEIDFLINSSSTAYSRPSHINWNETYAEAVKTSRDTHQDEVKHSSKKLLPVPNYCLDLDIKKTMI